MKARRRWTPLLATFPVLVLLVYGCSKSSRSKGVETAADWVQATGLTKAVRTHTRVSEAVALANQVLRKSKSSGSGDKIFRIVDGWEADIPDEAGVLAIPLFLVHSPGAPGSQGSSKMWLRVPEGKQLILLEEEPMDEALQVGATHALETGFPIQPEQHLAIMLLHETGHIANGDFGSYNEPVPKSLTSLNITESIGKSREFKADAFAAEAIASAAKDPNFDEASIAAMNLSLCLTNLSWNFTRNRLLDNFGATELNRPSAFWDAGNSHPNMELRILTICHLLTRSEASAKLLDEFLSHRKAASSTPTILWENK